MTPSSIRPKARVAWLSYAHGSGPEAETIQNALFSICRDLEETATIGQAKAELREDIIRLFNESKDANWDGRGAEPVIFESYNQADLFRAALPHTMPSPEVSVDPDGEYGFEWRYDRERVFSVSIGAAGQLTYAGIYGPAEVHGVEAFDGDIPDTILDAIRRVFQG